MKDQQTVCYVCTACGMSGRPQSDYQLRKDENANVYLDFDPSFVCSCCKSSVLGSFKSQPICIVADPFYETLGIDEEFNLVDIPIVIELCRRKFSFVCCTIGYFDHFRAVFCLNKLFWLKHDMDGSKTFKKVPNKQKISKILYA